jgi:hypothetical protein
MATIAFVSRTVVEETMQAARLVLQMVDITVQAVPVYHKAVHLLREGATHIAVVAHVAATLHVAVVAQAAHVVVALHAVVVAQVAHVAVVDEEDKYGDRFAVLHML